MSEDITMLVPPLEDMLEHLLPSSHPAQSHVKIKSQPDSSLQSVHEDGLSPSAVPSMTPPQEMPDTSHNVTPANDVVIESQPHPVPQFLPDQNVLQLSQAVLLRYCWMLHMMSPSLEECWTCLTPHSTICASCHNQSHSAIARHFAQCPHCAGDTPHGIECSTTT